MLALAPCLILLVAGMAWLCCERPGYILVEEDYPLAPPIGLIRRTYWPTQQAGTTIRQILQAANSGPRKYRTDRVRQSEVPVFDLRHGRKKFFMAIFWLRGKNIPVPEVVDGLTLLKSAHALPRTPERDVGEQEFDKPLREGDVITLLPIPPAASNPPWWLKEFRPPPPVRD